MWAALQWWDMKIADRTLWSMPLNGRYWPRDGSLDICQCWYVAYGRAVFHLTW